MTTTVKMTTTYYRLIDHMGDAFPACSAQQQHAMNDMRKLGKYQLILDEGIMHIVTLLSLLSACDFQGCYSMDPECVHIQM